MIRSINELRGLLSDQICEVWPKVAQALDRRKHRLMGGTAVTIHLRHRQSFDLDFMALRSFDGRKLARRFQELASSFELIDASTDWLHLYMDDAQIQVFRDRGVDGAGQSQWIEPGHNVSGVIVGSMPDLFAAKLDVIMYRPKLRDYIDITALDTSSPYRLEDGLRFHQQRYGTPLRSNLLDRIISLLDDPGVLAEDRATGIEPEDVLTHLKSRAVALRGYLHQQRQADSHSTAAKQMPPTNPQALAPFNLPSQD